MALAFSLVDTWDDGKRIHVSGTIAATGNYATGGDTVDLSQVPVIASTQPPIQGTAWMDGLAGYDYVFIPGAAMNSNKVKMFASAGAAQAAFPELTAGAYPGAITGDTMRHKAARPDQLRRSALNVNRFDRRAPRQSYPHHPTCRRTRDRTHHFTRHRSQIVLAIIAFHLKE
jgi:hypothetical protein